ncbi:hypothetical protein EMG95_28320, partial [Klebsiella pneumoniae]
MRFFAINLASKGTARLSILPLSWATMSCAFQAIPEREASGSLPDCRRADRVGVRRLSQLD